MEIVQRRLLGWTGAAVGLVAAAVTGLAVWLSRGRSLPGDLRLIAAGLGLLALIMALRCCRIARSQSARG